MRSPVLFLVAAVAASSAALPAGNDTSKVTVAKVTDAAADDLVDYEDVSGRQNSRCLASQFQCVSGRVLCVQKSALCNGRYDCSDGSDESNAICYQPPTTESSGYPLQSQDVKTTKKPPFSCRRGLEFECRSDGKCIDLQLVCDNYRDCADGSDEEATVCNDRPGSTPPADQCAYDQFRCNNGECIALADRCDGTRHCSDNSDEDWNLCQSAPEQPPTHRPGQGGEGESGNSWESRLVPCNVPQQPQNGRWRLHRSLCDSGKECSPPSNVRSMDPGSYIVYSCNPGFLLKGSRDVLCGPGGQWVHEPKCEEIRCPDLSSSAIEAFCLWNNVAVSCEVPAPIGTAGNLKCRQGFVQEVSYTETHNNVTCQADGKWSPKPIQCVKKPKRVKLVLEGDMTILD